MEPDPQSDEEEKRSTSPKEEGDGGATRKRKNATSACDACRKLKIKCDCQSPCLHCKKHSRLCIFSPRKRRGPAPKYLLEQVPEKKATLPLSKKNALITTSIVVNHYLKIFLSHIVTFFKCEDMFEITKLSINDVNVTKPMKLQLFSALSCSARGAGNLVLAEKLFVVARQIARDLYDEVDVPQNSLAVAAGFTLMAVSCCAKSRQQGSHYIAIAESLVKQTDLHCPGRNELRTLIQTLRFQIAPFRTKVAISVPRIPALIPDMLPSTNHPVLTSMTQAFDIPLSPSSCLIFSSCLSPTPVEGVENTDKINILLRESIRQAPALTVIEFSCFAKTTIYFYSPWIRLVFESDEIKEEFCKQIPGGIPRHICTSMLAIIDQLMTHISDDHIISFSLLVLNVIRAYLFFSMAQFEQAIFYGREFINGCLDTRHYDRILHSPSYLIAPEVFVAGYLFCRVGFLEDADRAIKVLTLLEKTGYISAISGLRVLRSLKHEMERNPMELQLRFPHRVNVSIHPPQEHPTSSTDPTAAAISALFQASASTPTPTPAPAATPASPAVPGPATPKPHGAHGEAPQQPSRQVRSPIPPHFHARPHMDPLMSLSEVALMPSIDPTYTSLSSQFPDSFPGAFFPTNGHPPPSSHTPAPSMASYLHSPQPGHEADLYEMLENSMQNNPGDFINMFWDQGNDAIISELEAIFHESIY